MIDFSSVIICNDMVKLEKLGLLEKVYIFSGWMLSLVGFKYFVEYFFRLDSIDE